MKNKLSAVSIVGNIALLAGLLWMRSDHEAELREVHLACMRGDEIHLDLHAMSLKALTSSDPEEVAATMDILRQLIATGEINKKARRRAGLLR